MRALAYVGLAVGVVLLSGGVLVGLGAVFHGTEPLLSDPHHRTWRWLAAASVTLSLVGLLAMFAAGGWLDAHRYYHVISRTESHP